MKCTYCGHENSNDTSTCTHCGKALTTCVSTDSPKNEAKLRCLPSFILGIAGSLLGILGGICTTMCSMGNSNSAFFLIVGGSLIGLIGACLCLNKAKLGSILEMVGAIMIIYRAYFRGGSDFLTVIALLFLLFAGLIGLVYAFIIKRK